MTKKRNFPIFISLLIVSLFFTVVFYFVYTNVESRYESYMTYSFSHGEFKGDISDEDIEKIKTIDGVDFVGKMSLNPNPSKYKDDLIVLNYQDADINKMKEYSNLIEGRFSEKEDEIVLSKRFVDKNSFKLGDKISLDLGKRMLNGEEIGPTSTYTDRENFKKNETKTFVIVGIYEDVYNSYSRLNYGLSLENKMDNFRTFIKFSSFENAYENKDQIQREIKENTGKNIELVFDDDLISYYGVERPIIQVILSKIVITLSIIGCIALFVFFIKNIFLVWGLRKIRELSIYKSIGSTDFQIYLSLFKEGIFISLLPIVLGHILGYGFVYYLFIAIQKSQDISNIKYVSFNSLLSFIVLLLALIIVALAILAPAKKISKINIIDGIRENVDFSKSKKKKNRDL